MHCIIYIIIFIVLYVYLYIFIHVLLLLNMYTYSYYTYNILYMYNIVWTMEAETQLQLKRLPDSRVYSLIRSRFTSEKASGQNLVPIPMDVWQLINGYIPLAYTLPDGDCSISGRPST